MSNPSYDDQGQPDAALVGQGASYDDASYDDNGSDSTGQGAGYDDNGSDAAGPDNGHDDTGSDATGPDNGYDDTGSEANGSGNDADNGGGSASDGSGADEIGVALDSSPQVSLAVSDVLTFDGDDCGDCGPSLTIIDSAAVGVTAPTVVGVNVPTDPLGLGEGTGLV